MIVAHINCFSGISGDMTLGALVDAGLPIAKLRRELKKLGLDGHSISAKAVTKKGIAATKVSVKLKGPSNRKHRHYPDIVKIIKKSSLDKDVKKRALDIFKVLAEAEAFCHGVPIEKVHFHEVGAIDSIIDIVGAAIGFSMLGIDHISVSPINVGSGSVKTEHGILPVPAPATEKILTGVPTYADGACYELTTPTGAAIIKSLSGRYSGQPPMVVTNVGYGAGDLDLPDRPNVLRITLGKTESLATSETLVELSTNIDDMNPELFGYLSNLLFESGALDVTITPLQMKKGRPGFLLSALSDNDMAPLLEIVIFRETTTLGIRRNFVERVSLPRKIEKVRTECGVIRVKVATLPDGSTKVAPEYDDVAKAAKLSNVPFNKVYNAALMKITKGVKK